jgi:hypothetical protein
VFVVVVTGKGSPQLEVSGDLYLNNASQKPTGAELVVLFSKLTCFYYVGHGRFFEVLVAGLSAPSLQNFHVVVADVTPMVTLHVSRFIGDVEEQFSAIQLILRKESFRISLLTHSQPIDAPKPAFTLDFFFFFFLGSINVHLGVQNPM